MLKQIKNVQMKLWNQFSQQVHCCNKQIFFKQNKTYIIHTNFQQKYLLPNKYFSRIKIPKQYITEKMKNTFYGHFS